MVEKTGRMEETAKVLMALGVLAGIGITEFMRKPNMEVALALFCAL